MPDDVKSKISELEKELYSKDFIPHRVEDTLKQKEAPALPGWGSAESEEELLLKDQAQRHQMMKKFVKISIGFFVIAATIAGFIWWRGSNIISGENIAIDISAPLTVAGGDPFDSKFTITNNNKVSMESVTLLIEYPEGFYSAKNSTEFLRTSLDLGVITPGQSVMENVSTLLYGEDNTNKEVSVTLEYRTAGSNAILRKTQTYLIKIASSLVNIKLQMPKEVSSGQEVNLAIDVTSNSKDPINTLVVSAAYPTGFSFQSSDPAPSYGTNTWNISGLSPQEKRIILKIKK